MPNESFSFRNRFNAQFPGGRKKKESHPEPDTRSGFSESPRTAEPETEPSHEDTRPQKQVGAFENLYERLSKSPRMAGMNHEEKNGLKIKFKELLREWKYDFQRYDFDRVKAITDQSKPTPWRTNTEWNRIKKPYREAWRDLRQWAQENEVWDPDDEREFNKETNKKDWAIWKTTRNLGLNVAVGGLYGLGYAMTVGPWKLFGLGLEYASKLTDNEKYTKGMMEKMFKKKREKAKGEPKKEEWNKAKEYEVKQKVKKIEIEYLHKEIEALLKPLKESPEYLAATKEERKKLVKEKIKEYPYLEEYKKILTKRRSHWIAEGAWTITDEEDFRGEEGVAFDPENETGRLQYMLTPQEYTALMALENRLITKQKRTNVSKIEDEVKKIKDAIKKIEEDPARKDDPVKNAEIKKLKHEIKNQEKPIRLIEDDQRKIKEIEEKAEERANNETLWPPFSKGAKTSVEQESLTTTPQDGGN